MVSDNRIGPGQNSLTTHSFAVPDSCNTGTISAKVMYRPIPLTLAADYGWEANDYVISAGEAQWTR